MKKAIMLVAGARPNFVKIAPLMNELKKYSNRFKALLVHTGQHYDFEMSEIFFQHLKIPRPDIYLNVGSASHAVQAARIMISFETVLLKHKPALVVVVGDVNSTLASSLVAAKLGIEIAHVEAGLRSFDRTMPEEINRLVTDSLSRYLFVSERSGLVNLKREGVSADKTCFVGNIMIDTLLSNMAAIERSPVLRDLSLKPKRFAVLTLHRPNNVDSKKSLMEIYDIMRHICGQFGIVYPAHPRAKKMMACHNVLDRFMRLKDFRIVDPLGYIDFIKLVKESKFVLTDSGGIQEETTVLGVPCLTMRDNTERPVTITEGTNYLVGRDRRKIITLVSDIAKGRVKRGKIPALWDGRTAKRIVKILNQEL